MISKSIQSHGNAGFFLKAGCLKLSNVHKKYLMYIERHKLKALRKPYKKIHYGYKTRYHYNGEPKSPDKQRNINFHFFPEKSVLTCKKVQYFLFKNK